jgi:hypothetical protein
MSHRLISHSPDLKRLRDEGYFVQIQGGLLLLREIPYVNAQRQVRTGTLISTLNLAGDVTQYAQDHVAIIRWRVSMQRRRYGDSSNFTSKWRYGSWARSNGKALLLK